MKNGDEIIVSKVISYSIRHVYVVCLAGGALTLLLACGAHPVLMLQDLGP